MNTLRLIILIMLLNSTLLYAQTKQTSFELGPLVIDIEKDDSPFVVEIKNITKETDVYSFTMVLTADEAMSPPKTTIKWQTPSIDIAGIWTPEFNNDYIIPADWSSKKLSSMLTQNAPIYSLFGHDDINRYTVSVSDAVNRVNLSAKVREEDSMIYHQLDFFTEKHKAVTSYKVEVRIDMREIPLYTSLHDVASWWASMDQYTPIAVPQSALEPMYSTWYSYHQNITHDELLAEGKLAKQLGYGAIIVDDGWQTNDSNRGYAYTGDWEPERLTNIEKFVSDVHALGIKSLLWYSIPFVGDKSKAAKKFKGKYLSHSESLGTYVLDPRYPEVRQYLINHYIKAIKDWKWDGLKLDFIDQFKTSKDTDLTIGNGRDYASVYESVDKLMSDLVFELKKINPEVMIEFRQRYIGPAMRKYGNMFRATDIPNGAVTNRKRIVTLRLLSGDTAVHSDMLMWHLDEPVELAALQLLNVLYSVPQLSVRLNDLPTSHLNMVEFYTKYWNKNKHVLLSEHFQPKGITSNYPVISSYKGNKQIIALYGESLAAQTNNISTIDIINAKKTNEVILKLEKSTYRADVEIYTPTGKRIEVYSKVINGHLLTLNIPLSGLAKVKLISK